MTRTASAHWRRSVVPVLAFLSLAGCSDAAEPASPPVEGRGLIRGVVLTSTGGEPVEHAVVRLAPRHGSFTFHPVEGVVTDALGRYEIRFETTELDQPRFRGDLGVATTESSVYFRDTLVYNVPLELDESTATTVLDVVVDDCLACD